jgi:hypothetical protein
MPADTPQTRDIAGTIAVFFHNWAARKCFATFQMFGEKNFTIAFFVQGFTPDFFCLN